jgi:hypothetical protein
MLGITWEAGSRIDVAPLDVSSLNSGLDKRGIDVKLRRRKNPVARMVGAARSLIHD